MEINEVLVESEKSDICSSILSDLPNWFGIPEAVLDYAAGVKEKPFYAAYDNGDVVGFVSIKEHNPFTAEIYVMGILQNYHRRGLGRELIEMCESHCRHHDIEFLTVKTLDEKNPDEYYRKTRLFYESMGFKPLEVFPTLWDESNPCLFLAKYLGIAEVQNHQNYSQ